MRRLTESLALAALLACALWPAAAAARLVVYAARAGDTPESIAADYYGNRALALFISESNGLKREAKLQAGYKVRIPTAFRYRVKRGDTLEALALRFLDDKRRASLLAQLVGVKPGDKLREGQDLLLPFLHVHQADAPESLPAVARAYYGDAGKAKLLADFNFRSGPMLAKGEKLLVPVSHVRIRRVRLQPQPQGGKPAPSAAPAPEALKQEAELARRVAMQLQSAERAYLDGRYADVAGVLDRLLSEEDPSEAQLTEIFRLKAFAYVALGLEDLAVNAFREALARRPDFSLDASTVSPKIRTALDRAKRAGAP